MRNRDDEPGMNRGRRDDSARTSGNRLYRNRENSMIFGVCAGLADYFGFDVKITRVCVAIAGFLFFPTVVVIYLILGLLLDPAPQEPADRIREEDHELRRRVRAEPHTTLRSVRHRFRELDRRLQRLEKHVTSKRYDLERELDGLRE